MFFSVKWKFNSIFAHVVKYVGHGTLRLAMKGIKLTNTEGFLRKSDPFFELKKKLNGPHGTMWDSELMKGACHETK